MDELRQVLAGVCFREHLKHEVLFDGGDCVGMVLVQTSMNVRGRRSASVQTASARTHGVDTIASVVVICSTSASTIHALVSLSHC